MGTVPGHGHPIGAPLAMTSQGQQNALQKANSLTLANRDTVLYRHINDNKYQISWTSD